MMKKMTSMLLALAMCLALSVPAFAAGEEPELTADPAVQTEVETVAEEEVAAPAEVETEPVGEPVAQEVCLHEDYTVTHDHVIDGENCDDLNHAVDYVEIHTCMACGKILDVKVLSTSFAPHRFRSTEYGVVMGPNGETLTTYLYECRICGYSYIGT